MVGMFCCMIGYLTDGTDGGTTNNDTSAHMYGYVQITPVMFVQGGDWYIVYLQVIARWRVLGGSLGKRGEQYVRVWIQMVPVSRFENIALVGFAYAIVRGCRQGLQ